MSKTHKPSDTERAIDLIDSLLHRVETLQYQDGRSLDDICTDARLVIRRTFGQESVWMHDFDLLRFAPQGVICNADHHLMTGAWKDGCRLLGGLLIGMKKELQMYGPPRAAEPEVTWEWLWRRLPLSMWLTLGSLLLGAFAAGVALGRTSFIKELLDK